MRHSSILKQIKDLGIELVSNTHTWTLNGQTYSEIRHLASRGNIYVIWTERTDGSATRPMVCDEKDPSDPRCDYSGKVAHIYKVTKLAETFRLFEATQNNEVFKLVGNLTGMMQIKRGAK